MTQIIFIIVFMLTGILKASDTHDDSLIPLELQLSMKSFQDQLLSKQREYQEDKQTIVALREQLAIKTQNMINIEKINGSLMEGIEKSQDIVANALLVIHNERNNLKKIMSDLVTKNDDLEVIIREKEAEIVTLKKNTTLKQDDLGLEQAQEKNRALQEEYDKLIKEKDSLYVLVERNNRIFKVLSGLGILIIIFYTLKYNYEYIIWV